MITRKDMIERFGEAELVRLTDRSHSGQIADSVLETAMDDAVSEASGYLNAAGIALPVTSRTLTVKVCDIARYYLHEDATTQIVEDRYRQAVAWLKELAKYPQMLSGSGKNEDKRGGIAVRGNTAPDWRELKEKDDALYR